MMLFSLGSMLFLTLAWQRQPQQQPWRLLKKCSAAVGLASGLYGTSLGLGITEVAHAGEFTDSKNAIQFSFPDDLGLVNSPKPLKTHDYEVLYKSENIKGFNVGITRDPVRIKSIVDFATPQGLGDKVVNVELGKEGVFEAEVVSAKVSDKPAVRKDPSAYPSYDVEYKVDSSRGRNHYVIKATVLDKKLYVFTAQAKEASFEDLAPKIKTIVESLELD